MKSSLLLAFIIITAVTANATTYYFSANGNDASNGTSTSTPWQTLKKFNSVFASKSPGDNFLFNRGDIFYGSLVISRSGEAGSPITIGAYGTGANPVITGFTSVREWKNLGGNIWESTNSVSALPYTNLVTINGVNTAMGRYPNSSFLIWDSRSGKTSITSSSLNSSVTNWKGAELAVFTTTYRMTRHPITSHSGGTLIFSSVGFTDFFQEPSNYFVQNFLIQNDLRTLDVTNEWYYNPSTKKLRIYNTSMPTNVQIATVDTLTSTNHKSYITYDHLSFTGAGKNAIELGASSHISVQDCGFYLIGRDAIYGASWGGSLPGVRIINCSFNQINNTAIDLSRYFNKATITGNKVKNVGMLSGMMSYNSTVMAAGISVTGPDNIIGYNTTDSTGYTGIRYLGNNTVINNNFVNNFCIGDGIKDGGGIYTAGDGTVQTGTKVINNIVMNAGRYSKGIDCDDRANGIEIAGNTSVNTERGIYLHNAWNINIHDNTTFNNREAELLMVEDDATLLVKKIIIKNNIFVAKTKTQKTIWLNTVNSAKMAAPFSSDSNYFARPIDDKMTIQTYFDGVVTHRDLAGWQLLNGQDAHSKKSPKTIKDINDLRFEYNATSSNKTISLGANYIDVKNVSYNGTITLAPFTSAVLIKNGAASNQPPTANAGSDQTITLPTSSVSLSGNGSGPETTISSYRWTKISGPAAGKITHETSTATSVTALVRGVYRFQLKVTDTKGATGLDTVQITVQAAGNISPAAKAGEDQSIILPTSTVSLSGSGNDPDGTIASYNWTKISGPVSNKITKATSAATTVTALVEGVYRFQLKVTDNNAATDTDTVQITVKGSITLLPAVNPANTINGLDYKYYEANSYKVVPVFSAPVKTGTTTNFNIFLADRPELFSFNFTGFIEVPSDGQYTFNTFSDDGSNLYIDNVLVVNNDNVHYNTDKSGTIGLKAGKHAISVGYFNQFGGSLLTVSYEGPGVSRQAVPESALYRISSDAITLLPAVNPANTVNGLDYKYYEASMYKVLPVFSTVIPKTTGTTSNFDISLAHRPELFCFNFTGFIKVPADGEYTFYTFSDDGSNLYIDNVMVVYNDKEHYNAEKSGKIGLKAGKHAISVGYFNQFGGKLLTVSYSGPDFARQTVPGSVLYRISSASRVAMDHVIKQAISSSTPGSVKAYPDPFVDYIKIRITGGIAGEFTLQLIDVSGKAIWAKRGIKNAGNFHQSVNTSALQKGIYFLKIIQNNTTSVTKLVK